MLLAFSKVEEELIRGCASNDRLAQKSLYERYYGKMIAVCLRYASHKEQATEILNLAFLKVFKTLGNFNSKSGNLEGWIYRIMVNTAIDFIRSEIRHRHIEIDYSVYAEESGDIIAEMSAEHILELVNKLSPAYKAVFNLYIIEGYNHAEIGKLLDISEGTSKSNLAKARANLQAMIIEQNKVPVSLYGK